MPRTGRDLVIGLQFVAETGVDDDLARGRDVFFTDQNAARQDAERAVEDAHVLVEHHVTDAGAVQKRTDRRNEHGVVGPNQFSHRHPRLPPRIWSQPAQPDEPALCTIASSSAHLSHLPPAPGVSIVH